MQQYFFIPGRLSELSLAELKTVTRVFLGRNSFINSKSSNYFLLRTDRPAEEVKKVFYRLGGFIKYGEIIELEGSFLNDYLDYDSVTYAVSYYGYQVNTGSKSKISEVTKGIKGFFKKNGISARYVDPQYNEVSAAQIQNRNVLEKGFEIVILEDSDGKMLAGNTFATQPFEDFVRRDYRRPETDKEMGMLPPKLARMMVNLAGLKEGKTIWDPFCGSGTILLEALTLGYNVIGSDVSEEAVEATEKNILWLGKEYDMKNLKYSVFTQDIKNVDASTHRKLRLTDIDAVVFEPYMGPPQKRILTPNKAQNLLTGVQALYKDLFELLEYINAPNLKVVGILPSYKTHSGWATLRYNSFISKRWLLLSKKSGLTGLHWSRSSSIIRRNILIAELKR